MKKLLLMGCIVLGAASASFAQGGGGGGGRPPMAPADQAARLKTSLALTDDQTTKITAIYAAQATRTDSLAKATPDRQAQRPTRTIITAETNAKIKAVLTPDQAAAYQKQMDARMQGGRGAGGGGGGGGTPPPPQR